MFSCVLLVRARTQFARKRYSASLPARFGADIGTQPVSSGFRARSSAGEHLVDIEGVTGSIPVAPTIPAQPNLGSFEPASVLIPSEPVRLYGRPLASISRTSSRIGSARPFPSESVSSTEGRLSRSLSKVVCGQWVAELQNNSFALRDQGGVAGRPQTRRPRSAFRCSECRERRIAPRICWGPNRNKGFSVALASALER